MPTPRKPTDANTRLRPHRGAARGDGARLGRDDWLDAAFDAVAEGGFDQVRVLAIAHTLGVTRGSFYWHFADHAELIQALLARWHACEIAENLSIQAQSSDDPTADLEQLLDLAMSRAGQDLKAVRFELALRGLGRRDAQVAQRLVEVDAARMALFEAKFLRLTHEPQAAADLAALFYLTISGSFQALSRPSANARIAAYLRGVIADHLIHRQLPRPVS